MPLTPGPLASLVLISANKLLFRSNIALDRSAEPRLGGGRPAKSADHVSNGSLVASGRRLDVWAELIDVFYLRCQHCRNVYRWLNAYFTYTIRQCQTIVASCQV